MSDSNFQLAEYQSLRAEILERVKILHQILNWATLLLFVVLLVLLEMIYLGVDDVLVQLFALILPIIFAFLTFNYQANQMTLEAVAQYLHAKFKNSANLGWDDFYGQRKERYRLISLAKIFPLLFPQIIPIAMLFLGKIDLNDTPSLFLVIVDIFLLGLVLFNFRYKFQKNN